MNRKTGHIIPALRCAALCAALLSGAGLLGACSRSADTLPEGGEESYASLMIQVAAVDAATKADDATGDAIPDNERMHTLRILVFHGTGTAEHNRYVPLAGETEFAAILPVAQNEVKTVCLIANEESVEGLRDILNRENLAYNDIKDYVFVPDYDAKPVPMSCRYELQVTDEPRIEKTFHLVKAAAKFDIRFVNARSNDASVTACTFRSAAAKSYLLPHVGEDCGKYVFDESGNGTKLPFGQDGEGNAFPSWIEWLRYVTDRSQADHYLGDKDGWLLEYTIPSAAGSQTKDLLAAFHGGAPIDLAGNGGDFSCPTFYLPESRRVKMDSDIDEQEYAMDITLKEGDAEKKFANTKLPCLRALFRNTHVVVTVSFNKQDIEVEVKPYSVVTLRPDVGIERDEHGHIYAKDFNGNKLARITYDNESNPIYQLYFTEKNIDTDGNEQVTFHVLDNDGLIDNTTNIEKELEVVNGVQTTHWIPKNNNNDLLRLYHVEGDWGILLRNENNKYIYTIRRDDEYFIVDQKGTLVTATEQDLIEKDERGNLYAKEEDKKLAVYKEGTLKMLFVKYDMEEGGSDYYTLDGSGNHVWESNEIPADAVRLAHVKDTNGNWQKNADGNYLYEGSDGKHYLLGKNGAITETTT